MASLVARFALDGWDPLTLDGFGDWVGLARMTKTFTSGLLGSSEVLFLSSGVEGSRSYLAVERITATADDGRQGSVTVHHGATEGRPDSVFGFVVPLTGTGDLADWSGPARIEHDASGAFFVFDDV